MLSYKLDLKLLGPCKSVPLKKLKSSCLQMFFKIGCIKNFAIFTGKHLCWGLFLIKLQALRPTTLLKKDSNNFIKKRLQHRRFPVNIAKFSRIPILKNIYKCLLLPAVSVNPFHATGFFLYTLKISEKFWFSNIFTGYRKD